MKVFWSDELLFLLKMWLLDTRTFIILVNICTENCPFFGFFECLVVFPFFTKGFDLVFRWVCDIFLGSTCICFVAQLQITPPHKLCYNFWWVNQIRFTNLKSPWFGDCKSTITIIRPQRKKTNKQKKKNTHT